MLPCSAGIHTAPVSATRITPLYMVWRDQAGDDDTDDDDSESLSSAAADSALVMPQLRLSIADSLPDDFLTDMPSGTPMSDHNVFDTTQLSTSLTSPPVMPLRSKPLLSLKANKSVGFAGSPLSPMHRPI